MFPGLSVQAVEGKGLGVVTTMPISKGQYVVDYEYDVLHHSRKDMKKSEKDYILNNEGSYILEAHIHGQRKYLDATRCFESVGR